MGRWQTLLGEPHSCQVATARFNSFRLAFQNIHRTRRQLIDYLTSRVNSVCQLWKRSIESFKTSSTVISLPISWVIELQLMQALFRLWWSSETSPNPWQDCSIGAGKFSYVRLTRRGPLMRCQLPSDRLTPCNVSRQAKNKQTKNHKPIQEMLHKIHAALCRTNYCHSCELLQF